MLHIAQKKKEENIAEYLLYMWQMEDLLRAVEFDVLKLEETVLSALEDEELIDQNISWFGKLAAEMRTEKVQVSGHHHETEKVIGELMVLQQTLLTAINDKRFKQVYADAKPLLDEFKLKTDRLPKNDIETALTAIYGVLTLKLADKKVSPETRAAVSKFTAYIAYIASAYRDMKSGKLPINN